METKYGKVYVLEQNATTGDGTNIITPKLIESTFFSTIDFKWYDAEGNVSPLYEKYKGRSFAVQFHFNQKDIKGQEVELTGKINLPYKLGEIAHQDFENAAKASEEMAKFWRNHGVLADDVINDDGHNTVRHAKSASIVAALCPGWKIADIMTFYVWMDPIFILDDLTDKSLSQKDVTFKTSNLYWSALNSVVEGKPFKVGESEVVQKLSEIPKQYLKLMKGIEEVRKLIVEKKGDPTYVIQGFKNWHDALSIENCIEWKQKQGDPDSKMNAELQQDLRVFTCGVPLTFELILFDKGIQISEKVRKSFLFKSIISLTAKHCHFINDIISLKKEMDVDSKSNVVHIWHHTNGLSLQDACKKAVDRINLLEQVVNETGELLVKFYGEEGAVVFNGCKDLIYGTVQWHGITTRYHSEFKYDCIVEIE